MSGINQICSLSYNLLVWFFPLALWCYMEKTPVITVVVKGGMVADILIPIDLDVRVEVQDYDTDGVDEDDLVDDGSGRLCVLSRWS